MGSKGGTWADRASTKVLEVQLPHRKLDAEKLEEARNATLAAISQFVGTKGRRDVQTDYVEVQGAFLILQTVANRARATVNIIEKALEGRSDRFNLDEVVDRVLEEKENTDG